MKVNDESADYTAYMKQSRLPRTLLGGTVAMRDAGKEYLPQNIFETIDVYNARITRSFLFNAFKQTCSFLSGQVFQKEVIFLEDNQTFFDDYKKNIDLKGNNLDVFAKRLFFNGLSKGCSHILVEMPNTEAVKTKQEEIDQGIRPFLREIKPEDALGWYDENGKLLQVRIKGTKTEKDGKYGTTVLNTVLVLEPGMWELFVADKKGKFLETPTEEGTTNLDYIPLVTFIPGEEKTIMTGETPLMDLTYLNLKHWQSYSDQNNILHVGRVPVLFTKKIDLEKIPIGTANAINSNEDDSSMEYVEISGAAIAAGRQDLEDTKAEMALYGLQQLIPRTGNMTATEKSITSGETNSSLATWAIEFEDVLNSALAMMADYMKETVDPEVVELNKEYFIGMDSAVLDTILKTVEMSISSRKMAFEELKRRGVYENDYTWEDVEAEIEEDTRNDTTFTGLANDLLGTTGEETV